MIDATVLLDNFVALLRDIPDLVNLVGGDPIRISAYHDNYPDEESVERAVREMRAPGILVEFTATEPGSFGGMDVWTHTLTAHIRASGGQYYAIQRQMIKGVPSSVGLPMNAVTVHPQCYPMGRTTFLRRTDAEGLDYFAMTIPFTEMGDE